MLMLCFQSPFHRVKECYWKGSIFRATRACSFSPLFIGSRNVTRLIRSAKTFLCPLSVPFSSGQGMLPDHRSRIHRVKITFSPLFIGSRNVTTYRRRTPRTVSPFQSPFHRVKECYCGRPTSRIQPSRCAFSPLFIGSRNVTSAVVGHRWDGRRHFQSPFHRVKECY